MPQARSGGTRRTGASKTSSSSASKARSPRSSARSTGRSTAAKSTRAATTKRATSKRTTSKRTASKRTTGGRAGVAEARLEAAAQRLRKLNERIIEAGKDAGETTLTNYEKALKSIASTLERGPGSSEIEWVSNLATAQAKFIRDVTASWTSAAKKMLK